MRNVQTLVGLFVLTLSLVSVARGAEGAVAVEGRITAVQPDSNRLTVLTTRGEQLNLRIDNGTRLELDGRSVRLGSYAIGDPVSVRYRAGSEGNQALAVHSDATTARDVRQKMSEAMKTAGRYAYREKEKFQRQMGYILQDLEAQITRLEAKEKTASGKARQEYAKQVANLKVRAGQVRKELAKAGPAAEGAWEDVKRGTANALEGLGSAIDKTANWLRK